MTEIEALGAAELNAAIEAEIFGALPLTDEEWEIAKAAYVMCQGPHAAQSLARLIKRPADEEDFYTKLNFYLVWPRDYASDVFSASQTLVNKMRESGWLFDICDYETSDNCIIKTAGFQKGVVRGEAIGETDGLAIARAALVAVREWKEHKETIESLADTP